MLIEELAVCLKPDQRVDLKEEISRFLQIRPEQVKGYRVLRRSVDARRKNRVRILYRIEVGLQEEGLEQGAHPATAIKPGRVESRFRAGPLRRIGAHPVVVGTGPAGLFAALALCEKGYRPVILERGDGMALRVDAVGRFWQHGRLDPESNVQFGEGGAGTFSDGKLTTRSKHPLVEKVFGVFHQFGADEEILYEQRPHLGTEKVRAIVCRMRNRIMDMGGVFLYRSRMDRLLLRNGSVAGIQTATDERYETDTVFLATGHSARETYVMLHDVGVALEPKAFAMGFRVEHDQTLIDRAQYGAFAGHPELGAADYRVTWQDRSTNRGVYSFCNCPGGVVVAAASEPGGVVTNGMSRYARASGLSNAAIVVTVSARDFGTPGPLGGIFLQRAVEGRAYEMAGRTYRAPAQRTRDFLADRPSPGEIRSSYKPGVVAADIAGLLPEDLTRTLREALRDFGRKIRGFEESVLVAPETRTSSPVRILRDRESLESVNVRGLFPIGEGSGYTGGIVSSAIDGLKAALSMAER